MSGSNAHQPVPAFAIPDVFLGPPLVRDELVTESSKVQDETVGLCLPFLDGRLRPDDYNEHGVPSLYQKRHVSFLGGFLDQLPGRMVAADASRPWFLYWCLAGLSLLGEDVSCYRHGLAETVCSMQNESGGFGGGGKQLSHLATTYAVVLSLALVGGQDAFELVDRRSMWRWLCSLKQRDGGFQVCLGGEEDIRGAYCAAVIITLLNIPLDLSRESPAWNASQPNLFTGLADYVRRCQTFEGGISAQPNTEAHGAYAFCALACLSILGRPAEIIPKHLDLPRLIAWLASRQYAPEGGFSGRTNKLVDGCYSHWVGGCFPLIEACLGSSTSAEAQGNAKHGFPPVPQSLFNREGLIRYILCCCQDQTKRGGLRDKPGKSADPYHSFYILSGLSCAQHEWYLASSEEKSMTGEAVPVWMALPHFERKQLYGDENQVRPTHPVYVIPQASYAVMREYFLLKTGF